MTSTAYNLVIVGGTAGALSVAISSQRSGLGLVRVLAAGNEVAFPALVGSEQLDIGYGEPVSSIDVAADGEHLVVTTAKQTYDTRAVMVAQRPPTTDWQPPLAVSSQRVHVDQVPDDVADLDVLVIVARWRRTERRHLRDILAADRDLRQKVAGVILNRAALGAADRYDDDLTLDGLE